MTWPTDANGKITGHYIYHWRVPSNIHVNKQAGLPEVAVIEYAPNANRKNWILATNGMSQYRVRRHSKMIGMEVFGCFRDKAAWNVELFTTLARYPLRYGEPLCEFETLALDGITMKDKLPYQHLFFGQTLYQPETIGAIQFDSQNLVIVNQVFGIYDSELEYVKQFGGEALWNKMLASQMPDTLDIARQRLF